MTLQIVSLETLKRDAEAAVRKAYEQRHENECLKHDAVNWGDLHCVRAEKYEDDAGATGLRVYIEEASPDANELRQFVYERLVEQGYDSDIEVLTEW